MPDKIEFFFDFSSPYGFIASTMIDDTAERHGREVLWRPFLIGAVYKEHGGVPLEHPLKRHYALNDFLRAGRFNGIADMRLPDNFPANPLAPSRVFYWIDGQDPAKAVEFAKAAYRTYWIDGRDTSDPQAAVDVATTLGFSAGEVMAGAQDDAVKTRLRDETTAAMERGVFGSPYIIVDGEPFWGGDRMDHIDRWLATGGF
jgi:2-hydroxychromene-2-carboxylate isomerase